MTLNQPLTGCDPRTTFVDIKPQTDNTEAMLAGTSNTRKAKQALIKIHDTTATNAADRYSGSDRVGGRDTSGGPSSGGGGFAASLACSKGFFVNGVTRLDFAISVWLS